MNKAFREDILFAEALVGVQSSIEKKKISEEKARSLLTKDLTRYTGESIDPESESVALETIKYLCNRQYTTAAKVLKKASKVNTTGKDNANISCLIRINARILLNNGNIVESISLIRECSETLSKKDKTNLIGDINTTISSRVKTANDKTKPNHEELKLTIQANVAYVEYLEKADKAPQNDEKESEKIDIEYLDTINSILRGNNKGQVIADLNESLSVTKNKGWLYKSFEYLSHLNKWEIIYSALNEQDRTNLENSFQEQQGKGTANAEKVFTMAYIKKHRDRKAKKQYDDTKERLDISFEELIALSWICSKNSDLKNGIAYLREALSKKKFEMDDTNELIQLLCMVVASVSNTTVDDQQILKAKKLIYGIHRLRKSYENECLSTKYEARCSDKKYNSYVTAVGIKVKAISNLLEKHAIDENKKETNEHMLSLKHRHEFLIEKEGLVELVKSNVDSYTKLTEEKFYESSLKFQDIPESIVRQSNKFYCERKVRVPYIAISKYINAKILQHQFIRTEDGYGSMDSLEELVNEEDRVWYHKNSSVKIDGVYYTIPRLPTQSFCINPRTVLLANNKDEIDINNTCLFVPAWYATNISHWLIDVLPRIYYAKNKLNTPLIYILPKGPGNTAKETLELIGVGQIDIVWHDNSKDINTQEMYTVSRMASMYNYFSTEFFDFYNYLTEKVMLNYREGNNQSLKIYISRKDSDRRKCINELELEDKLRKKGFKILVLQEISFSKRIYLFANAKLVVGAAGAGLIHMLFMKDKTNMIILGSEQMHQNSSAFSKIAMHKSINLRIISSTDQESIDSPWTADIDKVLECVDSQISKDNT